jgi:hypothetical protein
MHDMFVDKEHKAKCFVKAAALLFLQLQAYLSPQDFFPPK